MPGHYYQPTRVGTWEEASLLFWPQLMGVVKIGRTRGYFPFLKICWKVLALPPEYWFSEGLSRAGIGGPNPISSIGLPWATGKAALIERPGHGWHRIRLSQGSRILGCLLSKMLLCSIGWTGRLLQRPQAKPGTSTAHEEVGPRTWT